MQTEDAYSSGHLVLIHVGTYICSNVETNLFWTCLICELLSFEHPSVLLICFSVGFLCWHVAFWICLFVGDFVIGLSQNSSFCSFCYLRYAFNIRQNNIMHHTPILGIKLPSVIFNQTIIKYWIAKSQTDAKLFEAKRKGVLQSESIIISAYPYFKLS